MVGAAILLLGAVGARMRFFSLYCTVTEIGMECWIAPEVAITVTV